MNEIQNNENCLNAIVIPKKTCTECTLFNALFWLTLQVVFETPFYYQGDYS